MVRSIPRKTITPLQLYMLSTQFLFTTIIGFYLGTLAGKAGFAAWLSIVLGATGGILLIYFSYALAIRRPDRFLGQYGHSILGNWLHIPIMIFIVFSYLFSASFVMRQLQDFVSDVYLPDTPEWAIVAVFSLCVAYAVRSGAETIFRAAQGFFFISILGVLTIPLFVGNALSFEMAIALINHFDPKGIGSGTYFAATLYGQLNLILFLIPYLAQPRKSMKSINWGVATSVIIVIANLIPMMLIFGPQLSANLPYPALELISYVRIGSFLENLDPVLIAVWLSSLFIKISLFLFVSVNSLTHIFALHDHKPFSFTMTATMTVLCLFMAKTSPQLSELLDHGGMTLLLVIEVIPILYLIVDKLRFGRLNDEK